MQTNEMSPDRLRRLAELRPEQGRVLSLYLNLDPSQFATPQARSTEVRSLLDQAERRARALDGLSHEERAALRKDIGRAREFFEGSAFSVKGAHGLALYACSPADYWEVVKLPRPVDTLAVIDDSPFIEPLAGMHNGEHWAVVLVSRKNGRILVGSRDHLTELPWVTDDVGRRHDQGGWSQARYQRSRDKDAEDHIKHTLDVLFRRFKYRPFDRLLLGAPEAIVKDVEDNLHPYLKERLAGRVEIDVENTSSEQVREAALPLFDRHDRERERQALDRLAEGSGQAARMAAGLDDVLGALNEQRVEVLLFSNGFGAPGVVCKECGWAGVDAAQCPVDAGELERRDDIMERAIELALMQSAEVLPVRHHEDELDQHGSIAAMLRF
jgi:peptide chain release factor subunit 1